MNHRLREFFVAKIRSGNIHIKQFNLNIKPQNLDDIIASYDVYSEKLEEAIDSGLMTVKDNEDFMLNTGQWTNLDDDKLKDAYTLVEDAKVALYENYNEPKMVKRLRKSLAQRQALHASLMNKKSSNYSNTAESFAETARLLFLIKRCCDNPDNIDIDQNIDVIIKEYNKSILSDSEIRDICKNEPWRSFWGIHDKCNIKLFYNEEPTMNQRNLVLWSRSYDGIHESPDCPPQEVIDDDDFLDGWFITQSRKRKAEANKKQAEDSIKNEKVKNSDNVFLMSGSKEKTRSIHDINTRESKDIKAMRGRSIKETGRIDHEQLPDRQAEHKANINKGLTKG